MAELFLARATGLQGFAKIVVLKRILPQLAGDPEFVAMFLDEARLAAQLDHANVVGVHDIGRDHEEYFFTMEYLHGEDVRAILRATSQASTRVPLEHALAIVAGVARGLQHAHERIGLDGKPLGLVHRDVSPTNVLVTYDGGVKLVDFGIAKAASSQHATRPSTRKGKTSYMSPEQCRGRVLDARSDVFALGVVLWEITTGRRLFRGDDEFAVMNQIVNLGADPPSRYVEDYPEALEAIVVRALAQDPDERYPSARALLEDLEEFAHAHRLRLSTTKLGEWLTGLMGPKPLPWESDLGESDPDTTSGALPASVDLSATRQQAPRIDAEATAHRSWTVPWLAAGLAVVLGAAVVWVTMDTSQQAGLQAPPVLPAGSVEPQPPLAADPPVAVQPPAADPPVAEPEFDPADEELAVPTTDDGAATEPPPRPASRPKKRRKVKKAESGDSSKPPTAEHGRNSFVPM